MSYYICNNADCENIGKKEHITNEVFKYVQGEGFVGEKRHCPICGRIRQYVNPDAEVGLSEKNIAFAQFSSASKEVKREMLRKRSHEHFNKSIKERKDHLMNQAITEMRNMHKD